MTALPQDVVAELKARIAELEQKLQASATQRDQALARQVAAENEAARLRGTLDVWRDRRNASADIIAAIANAPGDARRVLHQIAETSARLFGAPSATIHIAEGDGWAETIRVGESSQRVGAGVPDSQLKIGGRNMPGVIVAENRQVHVPDLDNVDPAIADWPGLPFARAGGTRSMSGSPLRRECKAIGALIVYRDRLQPFSDEEMALQQIFADQAAIAIENARLFNQTRSALERQNASAEILRTIASSPGDATRALQQIAETSARLFDAPSTSIQLAENGEWGEAYRVGTSAQHIRTTVPLTQITVGGKNMPGQVITRNEQINIPDLDHTDPSMSEWPGLPLARAAGTRTMCGTPLRRDDKAIGALIVYRDKPQPFTPEELALQQSFADQAVIAIENARLFNETREALERQTATADILKVIASSPSDVQPVFEAIATSAKRLIGGFSTAVFRFVEGIAHLAAFTPTSFEADEVLKAGFPSPVDNFEPFKLAQGGKPVQIPDIETLPGSQIKEIARARGFRSMLFAPLMSNGSPIGLISVTRLESGSFTDHHVQLLQTFSDQAVIAIENVRLFEQVQARTLELTESLEQQTATSEVLSVISRSAGDLAPVFEAMLSRAMQLCGASFGVLNTYDGAQFHTAATYGLPPAYDEFRRMQPLDYGPATAPARLLQGETFVEIADLVESDAYRAGERNRRALVDLGGARCLLAVPLLRDGHVVGTVMIFRQENRPFSEKQITLLKQFAAQAVIAIENTRLLRELRQRTDDLSQSLDDLRAAQDRLVQTEKLASLGQLTAGIAHEIKNPLNFVNNFAALSAELTGELNDLLASATVADDLRGEVDELTGLLRDNLAKVVQHGKRADSIVKNMLLHSREGSGEHRPTDINALVEESLNLAYHGARAEKPQFNVMIERNLDPAAGAIEVFPQEITRVLLNLISNGFYAVAKRRGETAGGFEPVLSATTRARGDAVEIRIRDNGTGIPQDVQEKMFNPFFTTKPAGEGTGLGLSMSHDIIVKQHGGTIEVDTLPGAFTEFTIRLPRKSNFSDKTRG
ncbi:histidine kinase [Bradyrhizobium guangdongense]|uniref:GAF domain-containing sensor histidine kinase n=1 Tax=Bradyrhizobium guangdongense TaxID=1325090 RepID=UPI00112B92B1|nr:GAF domain-containing sensor histidine kinase [Bradyrhizobium guangdongense]TPQ32483.1 histidine kinase [Bradyrhizobium guangdongense]